MTVARNVDTRNNKIWRLILVRNILNIPITKNNLFLPLFPNLIKILFNNSLELSIF